jgi:hypothetical protein
METSKLTGAALDWVVAKCEGVALVWHASGQYVINHANGSSSEYKPSSNWSQGGPIIERETITVSDWPSPKWRSGFSIPRKHPTDPKRDPSHHSHDGPTPLIASMRCYVASKLGDEIEIPKELL